jgi:hypothetical protein
MSATFPSEDRRRRPRCSVADGSCVAGTKLSVRSPCGGCPTVHCANSLRRSGELVRSSLAAVLGWKIETDRGQRAAADGFGPFGAGNARTDGPRITRVAAPSPPSRVRRVGSLFSTRAVHQRLHRQLCTQFGCFGAAGQEPLPDRPRQPLHRAGLPRSDPLIAAVGAGRRVPPAPPTAVHPRGPS